MAQKYRADIDGLRGIAVLAVVIYHAFPARLQGGFTGVDVFFVISGYLITRLILLDIDSGKFSVGSFYVRRIRRIFPALVTLLIVSLLFGGVILWSDEFKNLAKHSFASALFVANFALRSEAGYFDSEASAKPLHHLWSLGVEEQFYIFWPLIICGLARLRARLLAMTIVLLFASLAEGLYRLKVDPVAAFYLPQSRAWELLAGSALAIGEMRSWGTRSNDQSARLVGALFAKARPVVNFIRGDLLGVLGMALLLGGFFVIESGNHFPGLWAGIPVVGALLVIGVGEESVVGRTVLRRQLLVRLGRVSYPLYLWHWPLLSFSEILKGQRPTRYEIFAILIVALLLAILTYRIIEQPFRFGRFKRSSTRTLLVSMSIAGLVSAVFYASTPSRPLAAHEQDPAMRDRCLSRLSLQDSRIRYCKIEGDSYPEIAVIGDSHAAALFEGLKSQLVPAAFPSVVMIGGSLFVHTLGYGAPDEKLIAEGGVIATRFVASDPRIRTVIISTRGPVYMNERWMKMFPDGRPILPGEEADAMREALRSVLGLLSQERKKVFFIIENPTLDFDPHRCLRSRFLLWDLERSCSISKDDYLAEHSAYRGVVAQVLREFPNVTAFDPSEYICSDKTCSAKIANEVLYDDRDHLSVAGARFLASRLVKIMFP